MIERMVLNCSNGLHARPASDFVRQAASFSCNVFVRNVSSSSDWVNAKSILSILGLGVENNHTIEIKADGPDEKAAISSLKQLVEQRFSTMNEIH